MLVKLGGKENPTVEDIKAIFESVGIDFEKQKAEEIVDKLSGKDITEVINNGKSKLSVVSNGQTTQNEEEQKQSKDENENTHKEEEETLEIGGGFDDLFN